MVKNMIQKLIDEGTIDVDLLKSLKSGKKTIASNVATFQSDPVSCATPKMWPTYDQYMVSKPKHVNMSSLGHPQ